LSRLFIIIAVIISITALVQAQDGQGNLSRDTENGLWNNVISAVEVEGVQSADTFLVINSSGLVPGDLLNPGVVQDAVKDVYGLGLFSDVQIDASSFKNGVKVIIKVTEFPKLRKLKLSGNKDIKAKKIKESLSLFEGRLVSPEEIQNNIEKIKNLYSEKGHLLADVAVKRIPVEDSIGQADIEFDISEGKKVKIEGITFSGNQRFPDSKLRGKMSTKQKSFFRSGNFNRDKYLDDKDKVIDFYKNEGYIDAVILDDTIWYSQDMTRMFINIDLQEGSRYYFGDMTWEGNSIIGNDKFQKGMKIKPGTIFNQKKYDETIANFHELYQDEGYWYAQIDEKTIPRGDTLDFHLTVTENKPVHIRLVNVENNQKTMEKVIRREIIVKPGTVFKRSILTRSLRDLMVLNFFSNIEPGWDILPDGDIDLKLKVTEKETGQFSIGAGYSAVDKFVATIGLGVPNLFGTGQTATIDAQLGSRRTTFSLSYLEPWLLDTPTSLSLSLYNQDRDWYSWFTERRTGGDIEIGRRLRWPDNYFRIYGGYRLERVDYRNISSTYISENQGNPFSVDKQNWPLTTSAMSLSLVRDSRDLSQFATKGSIITWKGELAGTPILGGSWNYFQQSVTAEYYKTMFWKVVLMGRAKYGSMGGIYHGDDDIPYGERFAPGGVQSDGVIRGYDDGLVGPFNSSGAFLKGRFELIYNLELTIPISEQQFYIILFADAGNSYLERKSIHLFNHYYRSIGPGFRVLIPMVGIMGFDFGYALDGAERGYKGHWKTHFQIGRGF
jgi:outer membrane protein insertion porin family